MGHIEQFGPAGGVQPRCFSSTRARHTYDLASTPPAVTLTPTTEPAAVAVGSVPRALGRAESKGQRELR